jgi:vesicle coat complex subunit
MNYIADEKHITSLCRKLSPPLVTLLSKPPEVQYLALRNAILILQKRPEVLRNDIRVFFCNYNDPIYVKVTKLELMFMLTTKDNISIVLAELREYATEIDVHFVRKAVRAIGKLAIKIESAAKQCIDTLLELVGAKIPYIVQEATVVIRNIFRKYPNQYESIISHVIRNIDDLDEPEAKAAVIWIIGQYADRIENSDGLLQDYLATFHDETVEVQLALLTATVKLFIQRPTKGQQLVPQVLKWCTEETDDPDLRDRGYMYWRLLSTDPATAKQVVMGQKPPITAESEKLDPRTLEELCLNVGTLATVYLKPIHQVFRAARPRRLQHSPALQRPRVEDGTASMLEYNPPTASMASASTSIAASPPSPRRVTLLALSMPLLPRHSRSTPTQLVVGLVLMLLMQPIATSMVSVLSTWPRWIWVDVETVEQEAAARLSRSLWSPRTSNRGISHSMLAVLLRASCCCCRFDC